MTEMTAFERQVADEMLSRAGAVRPVDDLAVFDAVVAATPSQGWRFTMFSALKFVVASVIVALFGGYLLAGVPTTQHRDELVPATVSESPSPVTTEELLSGMVTEEVEPGVFRIVNDGVRDLSYSDTGFPGFFVDVAPDGNVWLSGYDQHGQFRLGKEPTFEDLDG